MTFLKVEELLFIGLRDSSKHIVEITIGVLLPVVTKWAFDKNRLQSNCFIRLLNSLATQIKVINTRLYMYINLY